MKLTVNAEAMTQGLNLVTRALSARPAHPAFEGVLFETSDQGLEVTCTNGELSIRSVVEAQVAEDGVALVPARIVSELMKKLDGEVKLSVGADKRMAINSQGSKTTIMTMGAADFPDIVDLRGGDSVSLPMETLKEAITKVIFAIASDELRKILTGCLMEVTDEEIRFVALDGFRLALQRVHQNNSLSNGKDSLSVILPGTVIGEVSRMLPDSKDKLVITVSEQRFMVQFDKTTVNSPLIAGEYINYQQILPESWQTAIQVNRQEMIQAIERAALMAKEGKNNLIRLSITEDLLTILASADLGASNETLPIVLSGQPLDIAFNARYLMDVLRNVEDKMIAMRFGSNVSPCVIAPIEGNKFTYLVLPVRTVY